MTNVAGFLTALSLVSPQEVWQDRKLSGSPEGMTSEVFGSLVLSPDKKTVAYMARHGGQEHVILGGRVIASATGVSLSGFTDDNRLVYSVNEKGASYAVVGDEKGEVFDFVHVPYSPKRGRVPRVAYPAGRGTKRYLVDGKSLHEYEDVASPQFSSNGRHIAFAAKSSGKWSYVIDGKPGPAFDRVEWLQLTEDGRAAIFIGVRGRRSFAVVGDKEYGPYEQVNEVEASEDGKVTAVAAAHGGRMENFFGSEVYRGGRHYVVVNGVKGPEYDAVESPTISPSGRVAYAAQEGGKWFVVVDGKKGPEFEGVSHHNMAFSPDGSSLAYGGNIGGKYNANVGIVRGGVQWLVVDHVKKAAGIWAPDIRFSPDGKYLFYSEWKDSKKTPVAGTKKGEAVDETYDDTISFSPDGRRVGLVVRVGREHHWKVLDFE